MSKRKKVANPRVSRDNLKAVDQKTFDLETKKSVDRLVWCKYHEQWEKVEDFYVESKSKAKYPGESVRNMCIAAWDRVKGKTDFTKLPVARPKKEKSDASLAIFLK